MASGFVASDVLVGIAPRFVAARRLLVAACALDDCSLALHVWPHAPGCPDRAFRAGVVTVATALLELQAAGWLTSVDETEGGFLVERAAPEKLEELVRGSKRAVEQMIANRDAEALSA